MLERAEKFFPRQEIVSRTAACIVHYTYQEDDPRVRKPGSARRPESCKADRVATLHEMSDAVKLATTIVRTQRLEARPRSKGEEPADFRREGWR